MTTKGSNDLPEELERRLDPAGAHDPSGLSELDELAALGRRLTKDLAPPGPRAAFLAASPPRLLRRIGEEALRPRASFGRAWLRPAWTLAAAVLALAFTLGSTGLVFAAGGAVPGDRLYGVKRGIEALQLAVSLSPEGDGRLLMGFADERLEEVLALFPAGRGPDFNTALHEYDLAVSALIDAAGDDPAASDHLQNHVSVLESVRQGAPEAARPGLDHALENSRRNLEALRDRQSGPSPSGLAPGQLKKLLHSEEATPEPESDDPGNGRGQRGNRGQRGRGRGKKHGTTTSTPTPTVTPTATPLVP